MKMYYFNPNDYGGTLVTCAESKEEAYRNVIKYLDKLKEERLREKSIIADDTYHFGQIRSWDLNDPDTMHGYTIDEYELNDVIEGEVS